MTGARLKHYGWGREGEGMSAEERTFVLGRYHAKFATAEFDTVAVPALENLSLREARVVPPASLAPFWTTERYDRAAHTFGKPYPDYVRAMLGDYDCAPDVVAYPRSEAEISAVMEWTGGVGASLTPLEAARASAAASSRALTALSTRLPSPSICAISPKSSKSIRYRALHRSKLGPMVRRWKTSSSRMASRCGISRRVLNIRPSAAGLRRDRAAISPVFIPTSTISSKACALSRQLACWRRADFPDRVPGPVPTGCLSARKESGRHFARLDAIAGA